MNGLGQILMVDDNEDDFDAVRRCCRRCNFLNDLEWCRSGEEAWDRLHSFRADLILLDLNMPGMGGRGLLKLIKGDLQLRRMPVVILTTSGDDADIDYCYTTGASTFVQKPVGFDGLTACMKKIGDYWLHLAMFPSNRPTLEKKLWSQSQL